MAVSQQQHPASTGQQPALTNPELQHRLHEPDAAGGERDGGRDDDEQAVMMINANDGSSNAYVQLVGLAVARALCAIRNASS